jgi:hypothetical protein
MLVFRAPGIVQSNAIAGALCAYVRTARITDILDLQIPTIVPVAASGKSGDDATDC